VRGKQFRCNHYPAALEPEESEAAAAGADAVDSSSRLVPSRTAGGFLNGTADVIKTVDVLHHGC